MQADELTKIKHKSGPSDDHPYRINESGHLKGQTSAIDNPVVSQIHISGSAECLTDIPMRSLTTSKDVQSKRSAKRPYIEDADSSTKKVDRHGGKSKIGDSSSTIEVEVHHCEAEAEFPEFKTTESNIVSSTQLSRPNCPSTTKISEKTKSFLAKFQARSTATDKPSTDYVALSSVSAIIGLSDLGDLSDTDLQLD